MNAKQELIEHIADRVVTHIHIRISDNYYKHSRTIAGSLSDVLPLLDFDYNNGYGGQELFGNIWYADGTWSERGEYDGSEWWEYKKCPDIPDPTMEAAQ